MAKISSNYRNKAKFPVYDDRSCSAGCVDVDKQVDCRFIRIFIPVMTVNQLAVVADRDSRTISYIISDACAQYLSRLSATP